MVKQNLNVTISYLKIANKNFNSENIWYLKDNDKQKSWETKIKTYMTINAESQ